LQRQVSHHHAVSRIFFDRFTKLLVHLTIGMVNTHGKFCGDTTQNGSHKSNQILSPGMVNLLLLVLRFLCKNRLSIIMPLLVFFSQLNDIAGAHYHGHGEYAR
jgi:hypothetical protein